MKPRSNRSVRPALGAMTRLSRFVSAATSLDGRRSSTRTAPRASSISRSTGLGAPAADTTWRAAKPAGIFARIETMIVSRSAALNWSALFKNEVERLAVGDEAA